MIEVRVEASREGERRLPDFVRKYPNFLEESEMTPKDPYLPAGYRKVEIYRNEKLGVVLQVFVFGQGQETVVHFHPDSCGAVQTKGSTANTLFTLTDDGPPVPTSTIIHYAGDSGGVLGPDVLNKDGKINDGHSLRNGAAGDIPERGTLLTQAYWDNLSIRVHGYSTLDFHGRGAADSPKGYRNLLLTKKGDFVSVENPFNIEGRVSRFEDGNPQNFEVVVGLDADAKPNKTVTVPSGGRIPHSKPTGLIVRPDTAKSLKEASHLAEEKGTNQI